LNPEVVGAQVSLGAVLAQSGRMAVAKSCLGRALKLKLAALYSPLTSV
jgi:hypothetical protein